MRTVKLTGGCLLSIYNLIRALSHPYPGADGCLAGQDFKIWDAEIGEPGLPDVEPGVILSLSERIHVQCGDNSTIYLKNLTFNQVFS